MVRSRRPLGLPGKPQESEASPISQMLPAASQLQLQKREGTPSSAQEPQTQPDASQQQASQQQQTSPSLSTEAAAQGEHTEAATQPMAVDVSPEEEEGRQQQAILEARVGKLENRLGQVEEKAQWTFVEL